MRNPQQRAPPAHTQTLFDTHMRTYSHMSPVSCALLHSLTHTYTYKHTHTHTHAHNRIHTLSLSFTYKQNLTSPSTNTHICKHTHTHIHAQKYIYTVIHTLHFFSASGTYTKVPRPRILDFVLQFNNNLHRTHRFCLEIRRCIYV